MAGASLIVTICALAAGVICLILYVIEAVVVIRNKARAGSSAANGIDGRLAAASHAIDVDEVARLIDAIGRLADSLSRAEPSLTSLIGAVLFFAIAAISSGALHHA